jgi:hypothetical protein
VSGDENGNGMRFVVVSRAFDLDHDIDSRKTIFNDRCHVVCFSLLAIRFLFSAFGSYFKFIIRKIGRCRVSGAAFVCKNKT